MGRGFMILFIFFFEKEKKKKTIWRQGACVSKMGRREAIQRSLYEK